MIHIISKEYYLKNKSDTPMEKIIIDSQKFPIHHKFFMKDGVCFVYLMDLGFLIVPKGSGFTKDILNEEIGKSEWCVEKYEKPLNLTKNYINSFPTINIYETPWNSWINKYSGYLRVWNIITGEDYIFYKSYVPEERFLVINNPKSYMCKLAIGDKVKFPIDINYSREFNMFIKNILEWI